MVKNKKAKFSLIFVSILVLIGAAKGETVIVPEDSTKTEIHSIMTLRVSLLSALQKYSMISGSLTALKPFEFGAGVFNDNLNGYFANAGYVLPWSGDNYASSQGMLREVFVVLGYRWEEPRRGTSFGERFADENGKIPNVIHSLTAELGLDATEWLTLKFGAALRISLGVQYLINKWSGSPDIAPLLDLSLGVAL